MTPKDYIIKKLNEAVNVFPFASFKFENDVFSNSNIVEVDPVSFYELDEDFRLWEEEVVFEFIEQYPDQNISFRTKNALVGIDNVDYEVSGQFKQLSYSFNDPGYNLIYVSPDWNIPDSIGVIFSKGVSVSPSQWHPNSLINRVVHFEINTQWQSLQVPFDSIRQNFFTALPLIEGGQAEILEATNSDNYSYAMAA